MMASKDIYRVFAIQAEGTILSFNLAMCVFSTKEKAEIYFNKAVKLYTDAKIIEMELRMP